MAHPQRIGKYEIVRRLGGGGMAEVFAAERRGEGGFARAVAIKRVLPGFAEDSAFSAMFIQEARLSARFDHPNVVSVLDFERDPEHGLFLTMELVEGRDLAALMASGRLPISVVIHVTMEILRGLGYAHHLPPDETGVAGVIHRDVSPHNVLLSWQGAVKVSDFGVAKARSAATSATASVMIKGKPAYMSPEQANGSPLDGRSDLFAVGVMLWEMLVGRPLFARATIHEMFAALFFAPIAPPRHERPDVPEDLSAVTMGLLARERDQRFPTAAEAVAALLRCDAAPKNGRAELCAVLRERFPDQAPSRPPRGVPLAAGTPPSIAPSVASSVAPPVASALPSSGAQPFAPSIELAAAPTLAPASAPARPPSPARSPTMPSVVAPAPGLRPRLILGFVAVGLAAALSTFALARFIAGPKSVPRPPPAAPTAPSTAPAD